MPVLMYLVKSSISGLVGVNIVPSGPVHVVFTVTGTSTLEFNIAVHERLRDDPAMISVLGGVTITADGAGTGM